MAKIRKPLRQPMDSAKMQQAIDWLEEQGYPVSRPTEWQLKIGPFNFYPDKGTILRDGDRQPHSGRGLAALEKLLARQPRERPTEVLELVIEPAPRRR
jgi:hypothetical protein